MQQTEGVTRIVFIGKRWVIKIPHYRNRYFLRGWMANRSEWRQRNRPDALTPAGTIFSIIQWYPRVETVQCWLWWDYAVSPWLQFCGYSAEEAKPTSWGRLDGEWLLIDYDLAWRHPRGLVGGIYYWNEERKARKWMHLPMDTYQSSS